MSLLISFNYLLLYSVLIVPIVLIQLQEEVLFVMKDKQIKWCDEPENDEICNEVIQERRLEFNNFVLLINGGVLVYCMLCEIILVASLLRPTNTSCSSYLALQLYTGLTMKAVLLVSAQMIALFIQDIDIVNFTLGIVLGSTLVISQIRAFQIWLVSIKKNKQCLQPRVD